MNMNDKPLDDLDNLIDSIGEKKNNDSEPYKKPDKGDESKPLGIDKTQVSAEPPLENNEVEYEPIKPSIESSPPPPNLPEIEMEPERRLSPMRQTSSSPNRIILLIASFIILLIFFFLLRVCSPKPIPVTETPTEKTAADSQGTNTRTEENSATYHSQEVQKGTENANTQPEYELSEDSLQGAAPMTVKPDGPVISAEIDPEIAAAVDALKIRTNIIEGSSTKIKDGLATTISSGTFMRFRVNHTLQEKNGETFKDEITVITPSNGVITVKGKILDSMKKTDYKTFVNDLKAAGMEMIKSVPPGESVIKIQLRMTEALDHTVSPDFLIGPRSVGPIELGMPLNKMKSILSKTYEIVQKRIAQDDVYYDTFKVLYSQNQPLFFIIGSGGKVLGIQVLSDKFKTSRGIGLGNKLGEFRVVYLKNGKVTISSTLSGIPFAFSSGLVVRFYLQGEGLNFSSQVFPDDLKISGIIVGNSPFIK